MTPAYNRSYKRNYYKYIPFTCPNGTYNQMATIIFTTQEDGIHALFHDDGEAMHDAPHSAPPSHDDSCSRHHARHISSLPLSSPLRTQNARPRKYLSQRPPRSVAARSDDARHYIPTFEPTVLLTYGCMYFFLAVYT